MAVKDKGSTVVFLCGPGMERKKMRKKEREREKEQLLVGVDRAAPVPHRQITLERTHHLCSFVELSHFNPWSGPFGNQLHNPPPSAEPQSRAPTAPIIQPCSCQHFHLCAAKVWCQVYPGKHVLLPKPPQQLACLMSVKNTRWGEEDGGLTL